MEAVQRTQGLARMALALSIGAVMLGFIAFLLSWITPSGDSKSVPLLLLAPGIALIIAGIALIINAVRSEPESWPDTYRASATQLRWIAAIALIVIGGLAAFFVIRQSSLMQLILVALISMQGPVVLFVTARYLSRFITH